MEAWGAGFRDEAEALLLVSVEVTGSQARDSRVDFQVAGLQGRDSGAGFQAAGLQGQDSGAGFQVAGLQGRDSTRGLIRVSFITSFTIRISSSFAITISSSFRLASGAGDTRGTGGILGTGTIPLILITTPTITRTITRTTTHMAVPTMGSMGLNRTVTRLLPEARIRRSKLRSHVEAIIEDQLTG